MMIDGCEYIEHATIVALGLRLQGEELLAPTVVSDQRRDRTLADPARTRIEVGFGEKVEVGLLELWAGNVVGQPPTVSVATEVDVDRALSPDRLDVAWQPGPHGWMP